MVYKLNVKILLVQHKNKTFVQGKHVFLSWQNDCGRKKSDYFAEWFSITSKLKYRYEIAMRANAHIKRKCIMAIPCVEISIEKQK